MADYMQDIVEENREEVMKMIESFNLDESQEDALIHALNSKLSLIQGPPGTGKTYIGV